MNNLFISKKKKVVPVIGKKSIVVNFRLLGPENSLSEVNDIFPLE